MQGLFMARVVRVFGVAFLVAAVALPALVAPAAANAAAATNHTTLDVQIGDCDIRGSGGPKKGKVTIEWRAADGTLRELSTNDSSFGYFGNDIFSCFDTLIGVQPGDTIKTTVKGASRTFTVPPLTVRVDRNSNRVWGTTKPNSSLIVWLDGRGPGLRDTWQQRNVHAQANGTYKTDFDAKPRADVIGFDDIQVAWHNQRGDFVRSRPTAPGVHVNIGRSYLEVAGQPGHDANVTLLSHPGGSVVASTSGVIYQGLNGLLLLDGHGNEVAAAEGQEIDTDLATDASFVIPRLDITADKKTDVVRLSTTLGAGIGVHIDVAGPDSNGGFAWLDTDFFRSGPRRFFDHRRLDAATRHRPWRPRRRDDPPPLRRRSHENFHRRIALGSAELTDEAAGSSAEALPCRFVRCATSRTNRARASRSR